MTIKENDFRKIDLNLLIAFAVLYREQSVSAAADKLHLGQPAVSGVLSRLRTLFDDPLFIRSGHKMQPTARASELHSELLPLLEQLKVLHLLRHIAKITEIFCQFHSFCQGTARVGGHQIRHQYKYFYQY